MIPRFQHVTRLGLDASIFIYHIECHPVFGSKASAAFSEIDSGQLAGITSALTLTEVLVKPIQQNNTILARNYRELLANSINVFVVPVGVEVAGRAADLRARYGIRTPDAIHIATALEGGCEAFLTNDRNLKRVTDLDVILLEEI